MTKFIVYSFCEKSNKNNLRIISKQYAHLQLMTKTTVEFQKKQHKTREGAAYTRYIVSNHFGQKMTEK